jgi:4-amino-4-deoxy-L-arabinose transferase-like glycosyltransferase
VTRYLESYLPSKNPTEPLSLFDQKPRLLVASLLVLFLMAGALRLYHIKAPGLLIDREYTSAIFARAFYFEHTDAVEEWQKEIAYTTKQKQPILEPPITEYLVSLIYRVMGSEQLWVSHLLTSLFWLIGGVFLYQIAKKVVSTDAAVFATTYYLFVSLGILISRSFQPDSLMILLFLISLYSILRYYEKPKMSALLIAGSITGLTLLYRPLVLFTLMGAYTSLAIYQRNSWKFIFERNFLLFVAISLLPSVIYYGYGIFIAGYLRWKIETSFRPHLYLHREYWKGWLLLAINGAGYLALIGALIGLPILRKGLPQALLLGLWVGYLVFGLVFTMHIHTHTYYQAQLIPIVAFSLSSLMALIPSYLRQLSNNWFWWLPIMGALLLTAFFNVQDVRGNVGAQVFESEQTAREVGEIVKHSSNTAFVARFYGLPLQYYGQFSGAPWPKAIEYWLYRRSDERALSIEERLNSLGFAPEYFVITDFDSLNRRHADLKEFLETHCSPIVKDRRYIIYDGSCFQ